MRGKLSKAIRGWLTSKVQDRQGIWQMGKGDEMVVQDREDETEMTESKSCA